MNRTILKNITFAVVVVIVGVVLRSIDTLALTRAWRWPLGDVVGWASFTAAAAMAAYLAGELGSSDNRPVLGSPALSRILAIVALGVSLWLLNSAIRPVMAQGWLPLSQKIFAFGVVALAAYALWVAHQGFDELARALAPARPAGIQQPRPSAAPTQPEARSAGATQVHCPRCGAAMSSSMRFCGSCGTSLPAIS